MEAEICLPYGDTYINLKNEGFNVLRPQMKHVWGTDENEKVIRAMQRPIASPPLESLASKAKTAVVIISDHTRPVPSKMILPNILKALRRGNPFIEITLLVATGCHRETKREELRQKLGDSILEKERIVIHDCDRSETVNLGCLPSGAILKINKLAAEADLLVSEGFIEPHLFAGFSGGRKSVLPGICSRLTVLANHCGTFINDKNARTGRLEGNPIHEDMTAAVKLSKLAYIVNVIIDEKKNIIAAFAGDPVRAHLEGCKVLAEMCRVKAVPADICITTNGGAPLDQNVYQSIKGMTAAEQTALPGGVIIMCAECRDGIGSDILYQYIKECASLQNEYEKLCRRPPEDTFPDQWQIQILLRILLKYKVIFVTRNNLADQIREMKMSYAETIDEALNMARNIKGETASVTVVPNGVGVIVE